MEAAELHAVERWLLRSTGLQADLLGHQRLERAVSQRMRALAAPAHQTYQERLEQDPGEQRQLLELLVVGESWFLREPRSFAQLQELARREPQRPLRVLSCGCAGGEEPYSVVISLQEAGLSLQHLQVEAIDISAAALQRASEAVYGSHALRGLDQRLLRRHFQPEQSRWRLRPEIRRAVRFHCGALPQRLRQLAGGWHAVFCRNVMLYLHPDTRRELLQTIAAQLQPEGLLLVAAAEAPMVSGWDMGATGPFQRLSGGHGAAFQRRGAGTAVPASPPVGTSQSPCSDGSLASARARTGPPAPSLPPDSLVSPPGARAIPQAAQQAPGHDRLRPAWRERLRESPQADVSRPNDRPIPIELPQAPVSGQGEAATLSLEPTVHLHQARRLLQQQQPEQALQALRRCLYLDPVHLEALELGADLARQLGRHEEAERQLQRLRRHRHGGVS